ncbi:dynamin family protein [Bacillus taeanensis]|uniref:Dynamin N-terminal domain-containing protein n=1 Tax=Bacillus taeanensis TaxID=273032 RepID=A0A366XNK3_9BACI|nr:dynamin family protein [Bacillus taeanensis]RBW67702.1 hypothetical protein DS031_20740 [Bacillus taeanensis]
MSASTVPLSNEQLKNIRSTKEWIGRLSLLYNYMNSNGDENTSQKVLQYIHKLQRNEFSLAFCGHFSAGKSSMINELWGIDLLPSSPIPTSANLVKVKTGQPYARVYFKNQDPIEFAYPYDINKVKGYCINGDEVEAVEISHPTTLFPENVVVMDTPGIDSTDDAHRVSTESSLHLADVVFYVMDYNHVQSELNFHFAKQLQQQGKKVIFIINQVDKHNESEVPFFAYKEGVIESFYNWGIEPEGIYYTSLFNKEHPLNELQQLKKVIQSIINEKERHQSESVMHAVLSLIEEHYKWFLEENEAMRETYEKKLSSMNDNERQSLYSHFQEWKEKMEHYQRLDQVVQASFQEELNQLLKSAILTPFEIRELAKQFLESQHPKFKVGVFFSTKKTNEEKERRLQQFFEAFSKQVETQLSWHLKELLSKYAKKHTIDHPDLLQAVYNDEQKLITRETLKETIKKGAEINGEYVLNYMKDLSEHVKSIYKKEALLKLEPFTQALIEQTAKKVERLTIEGEELKRKVKAFEGMKHLKHKEAVVKEEAFEILLKHLKSDEIEETISHLPKERKPKAAAIIDDAQSSKEESVENEEEDNQAVSTEHLEKQSFSHHYKERLLDTAERLRKTAHVLKELKGMKRTADEMNAKANRLQTREFTVALFGAFSAGKSSFANALIGDLVLPVSPNPTTATINKIKPVTDTYPHGTVKVKLKTEQALLHDLNMSLKYFEYSIQTISEVNAAFEKINVSEIEPKAKPHYSFLHAVVKGYELYKDKSGEELIVGLEQFNDFVAKEEKACFVEWIDLYYDCPLTKQGITLVDTPGADSINARHTGVAFDYIKNADVILFVTYYNHAFSNADREFLIQLGRVKDVFEMDKMFFIVNAADLAKDHTELQLVLKHVETNLLEYGIRNPRIFPASSQLSILAKRKQKERLSDEERERLRSFLRLPAENKLPSSEEILKTAGILKFEKAFLQFTMEELTEMAVKSAYRDIKKAVQVLSEWISAANENIEEKNNKKNQIELIQEEAANIVKNSETISSEKALSQEVTELIHYVKQRVFLRYNDAFYEIFNPAALKHDKQSIKKKLEQCLEELIEFLRFDMIQEMRATSLRVEKYVNQLLKDQELRIHEKLSTVHHSFDFIEFEGQKKELPSFHEEFDTLKREKLTQLFSMFKNQKQFFEQNGKKEMREAFQHVLEEPIAHYLQLNQEKLYTHYKEAYDKEMKRLKTFLINEINDYIDGMLAALSVDVNVKELKEAHANLQEYLN